MVDSPQQLRFCDVKPPYSPRLKVHGSYPFPWDLMVSGNFQSLPGAPVTATYSATNAEIAPTLHRNLSSGTTAPVELIPPYTKFEARITQLDVRLAKIVKLRRARVKGMFDIYNAFNANPVLAINTAYGSGLAPLAILNPRMFKFGVQMDF